jgi:hypothetical protein
MGKDIKEIISHFNIKATYTGCQAIKTGHINESYFISVDEADNPGYFLQSINYHIFKDVPALMENIRLVLEHLNKKAAKRKDNFKVLELIPTTDDKLFYKDNLGAYWRIYKYLPGAHSFDLIENEETASEGGRAFGRFVADVADMDASKLSDTIPDFHNMETRLDTFFKKVENDPVGRKKEVTNEIKFVRDRVNQMMELTSKIQSGVIPARITHNDTKVNNVMFDQNNKAFCIVDLDTVMPGSVLFDFGDAIRTGANTSNEDEKDLSLVDVNLPVFKKYAEGFLENTYKSLTKEEIENLSFSTRFMTFIIGLRFLTDYIDGDNYFRVNHYNHNLERTRVQFRLVEKMEEHA